jgi:isocitrate dehydrogenase (NAD+)
MMLDYLEMPEPAARVRTAVRHVIGDGRILTPDLGGDGTTDQYTQCLLEELGH